jgi:hypothetical protein
MILTRKQLDDFDSEPMYSGVSEKRYLCPSETCKEYPADNAHRSLTVRDDGVFMCFRCSMKGKLASFSDHGVSSRDGWMTPGKEAKPSLKEIMG